MITTRSFASSALALFLAACASDPGAAQESQAQASESVTPAPETVTPAITTTQFVALFGKPGGQAGTASVDCALGEVRLFANRVPTNFVAADGRLLPISQNQAIFSQMGTTYGGDGRSTFALPNLKAVTPNGLQYAVCMFGTFVGP
jgi:hypothetical protein